MPNMAKSAESRLTNVSFGHQIAIVGSLQFVRKLCVIPWHSWHSTFVWIEQFPMPPCATATDSRFSNTQANIKQWNNHFSIFVALARTFAFNFFQSLLLISFDLTWLVLFDYKLYDWIVRCLEIYEWFGNDIRINARSKRMTALVSCTTSFVSFSVYNMDKRCWEIDWRDWFHGNSESIAATATAAGAILRWWRDLCFFCSQCEWLICSSMENYLFCFVCDGLAILSVIVDGGGCVVQSRMNLLKTVQNFAFTMFNSKINALDRYTMSTDTRTHTHSANKH